MALLRRSGNRVTGSIWTGFVDAMTALLLVLIFVLSIFMIVQYLLQEAISSRDTELEALIDEVYELSQSLGTFQQRTDFLESQLTERDLQIESLQDRNARQASAIASLESENELRESDLLLLQLALLDSRGQLGEARQVRLDEAAATAMLLEELQLSRALLESALGEAQTMIVVLEDELAEERNLRTVEVEEMLAQIAGLEGLLDEERAGREAEATAAEALLAAMQAERNAVEALLDEEKRERLLEQAAAEVLLEKMQSSQGRLDTALGDAQAMVVILEAQLEEEQQSRAQENATSLARIAELVGALDEERVGRAADEENAIALLNAMTAERDKLAETLEREERDRLADAAAAALLIERMKTAQGRLDSVLGEAQAMVVFLQEELASERETHASETASYLARIANLTGSLEEEKAGRSADEENAIALLDAMTAERDAFRERLATEERDRLADAAAAALLLEQMKAANDTLDAELGEAQAMVLVLQRDLEEERSGRKRETTSYLARIAELTGSLNEERAGRAADEEKAIALLDSMTAELRDMTADRDDATAKLDREKRDRLAEAAAAALLIEQLKSDVTRLDQVLGDTQTMVVVLEDELAEIRKASTSDTAASLAQIARLKGSLEEEMAARASDQETATALLGAMTAERDSVAEELDRERQDRLAETAAAALLIESLESERDDLENGLDEAQSQIVILRTDRQREIDSRVREAASAAAQIASLTATLDQEERARLAEAAAAALLLRQTEEERDRLAAELAETKSKILVLQETLKGSEEASDRRIAGLAAQVTSLAASLDEEKRARLAEAAAAELLLKRTEDSRGQMREELEQAQSLILVLEDAKLSSEEEAARASARIASLLATLDQEKKARLAEAAAAALILERTEAERDRLKEELGQSRSMVFVLDEAVRAREEEAVSAAVKLASLTATLDEEKKARLAEAAAAALILEKTKDELQVARTELDDTRSLVFLLERGLKDRNRTVRSTASSLQDRMTLLLGELDEEKKIRVVLEDEKHMLQLEIAALRRMQRIANESAEAAREEIARLTSELAKTQQEAEKVLTVLATARLAENDLKETNRDLEGMVSNLQLDLERKQVELEELLASVLQTEGEVQAHLTREQEQAELLQMAQRQLESEQAVSLAQQKELVLLRAQLQQVTSLLQDMSKLLDAVAGLPHSDDPATLDIAGRLNTALVELVTLRTEKEQRDVEDSKQLERYRSEFFGRLREIVENYEGITIIGDRFSISAEVLFESGRAELSEAGQRQLSSIASLILEMSREIPSDIDWILRVDGHTDNIQFSGDEGEFRDNWELSQGRALSVVRTLIEEYDVPPWRLAAAGFSEYRPIRREQTAEARARNRRIELKLTEP